MYRYPATVAVLFAASLWLSACTSSTSSNAQSSASPGLTTAPSAGASPVPSATGSTNAQASPAATGGTPVTYTDISGKFGQKEITDLAALGVFGTPSGKFNPAGTITRAEFARWLLLANNAIWQYDPNKQIHPSQSTTSAFPDVWASNPDFTYIQGLYDAGFTVGFPDKTFRPDSLLTREQMIAIKEAVDRGGVDKYYVSFWDAATPDWKDKQKINQEFRGAIAEDSGLDRQATAQHLPNLVIGNIPRTYGAIAMLRPQQPVTRAEAALVLWNMGAHTDKVLNAQASDVPRSAADALVPTPAPSPSPTPT